MVSDQRNYELSINEVKVSQVEGEEKIKQQNVKSTTLSFYP